jgi:hypothetical protein
MWVRLNGDEELIPEGHGLHTEPVVWTPKILLQQISSPKISTMNTDLAVMTAGAGREDRDPTLPACRIVPHVLLPSKIHSQKSTPTSHQYSA